MGSSGRDEGVGEGDILKIILAGRQDCGAEVDLGGIEQIEDGEVLDVENLVHAFQAESTFLVEEIGDMGLFKSGLVGELKAGELSGGDALLQQPTKVVLQGPELHKLE